MTELRVMAVTNDGTRLVLRASDGQEYSLPIDDRLRAAVRGDRARLGQIEIELDAQLRPRDIQARIRAGATADEVAELAGIPVERVRRFEGPVLAERAFMAERAQNTQVRRQGETHGPKLGEVVTERLLARGVDLESVQWDSWRRDDGSWIVRLAYTSDSMSHMAQWAFDPPRRLVTPSDDDARALCSENVPEPTYPFVPRIARLPQPPPNPLTTVDEDDLADLLESVPGLRAAPVTPVTPVAPVAAEEPPEERGQLAQAGRTGAAGSAFENALFPRVASPHRDRMVGTTDRQAEADGVRPGRRATVPTWDEIVFGSRRKKSGD